MKVAKIGIFTIPNGGYRKDYIEREIVYGQYKVQYRRNGEDWYSFVGGIITSGTDGENLAKAMAYLNDRVEYFKSHPWKPWFSPRPDELRIMNFKGESVLTVIRDGEDWKM